MSRAQRDAAVRRMFIERRGTRLLKSLVVLRDMAIRFGAPRECWDAIDKAQMDMAEQVIAEIQNYKETV